MNRKGLNWIEIRERIMKSVFTMAAFTAVAAVIVICVFLFSRGIPAIAEIGLFDFITGKEWRPTRANNPLFGILPMILGSIYVTAGAIIIGVPIGILTAMFMAKMCPKPLYRVIKPLINLLAGVPSVVYGFFGLIIIVPWLGNVLELRSGSTMLAASILLGIMILPTIITITETSIRAVPDELYEGALALGASHTRSVFRVILPAAKSGVMAAIVLGIGRAIGETMAVRMVAGNQPLMRLPWEITQGVRTLTTNIVLDMSYAHGLHLESLIATGVVLFVFIILINLLFTLITRGSENKKTTKVSSRFSVTRLISGLIPDSFLKVATWVAGFITVAIMSFILGYILTQGIPYLAPELFEWKWTPDNQSMLPSIVNTFAMVLVTLTVAVPFGVFSAIYLVEYAKRGNKFVKLIRIVTETLAGIPSIVYGLFGMIFFVVWLGWGLSLMSGAFTLAIMVLPIIMRTTEESLKAVPDLYREGSFGLGAGRVRTVFRIVLPAAMPGILAGVILSVGRIVGETAALMFTAGSFAQMLSGPSSSTRTLAVHMYFLSGEGVYREQAYATAVILLILVIVINAMSSFIASRVSAKKIERK